MLVRVLILLSCALVPTFPAYGAGDAAEGERLAKRWCAGCHAVEQAGSDLAPPLQTIARKPGRDEGYLFLWLSDPHPPMPQLQLSRQEIGDIIAYLQTLGGRDR